MFIKECEMKVIEKKGVLNQSKRAYLKGDVILTFEHSGIYGDTQEFFDICLPINKNENGAYDFLNKTLFKRVVAACHKFNRPVRDLIKISMGSPDWPVFERHTGKKSILALGHNTKWYFGNGRCDLDSWEKDLIDLYGFGTDVDMSYIDKAWCELMKQKVIAHQLSQTVVI
jgi:azurin